MSELPAMTTGNPFTRLGLLPPLVDGLGTLGYEEPTPIQSEAIPALLAGRDVLGQAATGTGKTAAFALPLLQNVATARDARVRTAAALVLVPTRELAIQVAEAIHRYGRPLDARVAAIYGGAPMSPQIRVLGRGVEVVVATPGRALDHVRRGTLRLDAVRILVLDEADEMLDLGFAEDLDAILDATPRERQTALFSATMPGRIGSIAERHLDKPVRVRMPREPATPGTLPRVRQIAYFVSRANKPAALLRILDSESPASVIVFCRTRLEVDELTETLRAHGDRTEAVHGGLAQRERDRVMKLFREGKADVLVATDVAARGLDIARVSHVVNYDVPSAPEAYLHRIGRTGRVGRKGVAITLAEAREHRLLRNIEAFTKQKIEVANLPTAADLHSRRLERLAASLRERLLARDFDDVRVVVESLAGEFDLVEIAAAAVRMAQASAASATPPVVPGQEPEIRRAAPRERAERPRTAGGPTPRASGNAEAWKRKGWKRKPGTPKVFRPRTRRPEHGS